MVLLEGQEQKKSDLEVLRMRKMVKPEDVQSLHNNDRSEVHHELEVTVLFGAEGVLLRRAVHKSEVLEKLKNDSQKLERKLKSVQRLKTGEDGLLAKKKTTGSGFKAV